MLLTYRTILVSACLSGALLCARAQQKRKVSVWLTDPGKSVFFKQQAQLLFEQEKGNKGIKVSPNGGMHKKQAQVYPVIRVDENERAQRIDGYGFALTGGSAYHIIRMSPVSRAALLQNLFAVDGNNIGTSYLRISIGASDLDERVFSYDDLPEGQTDTSLSKFDLGPDRKDVIPVLKEILAINPGLKILGSPWSPPTWMKTNHDTKGGSLLPEYYSVYANYFVRYIQTMAKEGIRIDAVTVQNEPLHPGNNPSLLMLAPEQDEFVKHHLGPAFQRANLNTKIIIYDHNADKPEYPISILDDAEAAKFIDGSAFHLYAGDIAALSRVHAAHPDKNLYFTEQWVGGPGDFKKDIQEHIQNLIIGAERNWSRTVLEWNLAADPNYQPHTDRGGCDRCLGAVTIDGDKVTRNPAYYIIAHAAKFVRPGAVRIGSNSEALPNVAFRTPAGKTVLIVLNNTTRTETFIIEDATKRTAATLHPGSVATYVW